MKALKDADLRHAFQDFISNLEENFQKEEKLKKETILKKYNTYILDFKNFIFDILFNSVISPDMSWKEVRDLVADEKSYIILDDYIIDQNKSGYDYLSSCRKLYDEFISDFKG